MQSKIIIYNDSFLKFVEACVTGLMGVLCTSVFINSIHKKLLGICLYSLILFLNVVTSEKKIFNFSHLKLWLLTSHSFVSHITSASCSFFKMIVERL